MLSLIDTLPIKEPLQVRREEEKEKRRKSILDAAEKVIARRGLEKALMLEQDFGLNQGRLIDHGFELLRGHEPAVGNLLLRLLHRCRLKLPNLKETEAGRANARAMQSGGT